MNSTTTKLMQYYRLHPLIRDTKRPQLRDWPNVQPTPAQVEHWLASGFSLGLICGDIIVFDFDCRSAARRFFLRYRSMCKCVVLTPRGVHFYFANPEGLRCWHKSKYDNPHRAPDVKGCGGYVVAPGSVVAGKRYELLPGHDEINPNALPAPLAEWLPAPQTPTNTGQPIPKRASKLVDTSRVVRAAARYVDRMPPAISGAGGHNSTMRVAGVLVQMFGLSDDDAMGLLGAYNERCKPPWTEAELWHKIQSAKDNFDRYAHRLSAARCSSVD